ncbi:MAG: BamA/TamA family outer membrane protein, partial [Pseudomonadota bacterium]
VESDDTEERRFDVDSNRATITFGVPITERLRSNVFYTYSSSDVTVNNLILDSAVGSGVGNSNGIQGDSAIELSNAFVSTGLGEFISSGLGYSLVYSSLDNAQTPREGIRANWSQTFFGVGGDANYLTTQASLVSYTTLLEEQDLIFMARVRGGHVEVFGGDDGTNFRVFDNFQARQNTIRGFDSFGYGPRDPITGDALGGQTFWNATTEVQFPLPLVPRSFGLRGAVFADVGQLTTPGNAAIAAVTASNPGLTAAQLAQLDDDAVRASVGGSILWASPFGPLRVDYAVPIAEEAFDERREFNFGVSSQF